MRSIAALALVISLPGCDMMNLSRASSTQEDITVTQDRVVLSGPVGFCIDNQSSSQGRSGAFVVFGNCMAILGSSDADRAEFNAIVTAAVRLNEPDVPKIARSGDQLLEFFQSPVGRSVLSRENAAKTVTIEEGQFENGALYIYMTDSSAGAPEGTEPAYWRGYFDVRNSVVTVSVLSFERQPLSHDEGLKLVRGFYEKIQSLPGNSPDIGVRSGRVENSGVGSIEPLIR